MRWVILLWFIHSIVHLFTCWFYSFSSFQLTEEKIDEVNNVLSKFLGTHGYHNFTSGKWVNVHSCHKGMIIVSQKILAFLNHVIFIWFPFFQEIQWCQCKAIYYEVQGKRKSFCRMMDPECSSDLHMCYKKQNGRNGELLTAGN